MGLQAEPLKRLEFHQAIHIHKQHGDLRLFRQEKLL